MLLASLRPAAACWIVQELDDVVVGIGELLNEPLDRGAVAGDRQDHGVDRILAGQRQRRAGDRAFDDVGRAGERDPVDRAGRVGGGLSRAQVEVDVRRAAGQVVGERERVGRAGLPLPVSTSWKFAPFFTTDAVASIPAVLLIASARPCSVTLPLIVTVVPPITSVPPEATIVVSLSVCVLVVPVTWRARELVDEDLVAADRCRGAGGRGERGACWRRTRTGPGTTWRGSGRRRRS